MNAAASPAPDSTRLAELQRAAQHKLGDCLLRLQQYEQLLKAIVANTDLAGEPAQLQALRDARVASVHRTTLGGLVSLFTGGYLRAEGESAPAQETGDKSPGDRFWFSFQQRMEIDAERLEAIMAELKELVELRNELVHHLLERFDLGQLDRCEAVRPIWMTVVRPSTGTSRRYAPGPSTWTTPEPWRRPSCRAIPSMTSSSTALRPTVRCTGP